jgi:methionine-rich copper-binding protein CopC
MTVRSALVALVLLASVVTAAAHASLERAEPRRGARLKTPPAEVKLWFTEKLEPAFSSLRVQNAEGRRVDRADGRVDDVDRALLRATLAPLTPGTYRVAWRVLSVDSHVSQGEFTFRFEPRA